MAILNEGLLKQAKSIISQGKAKDQVKKAKNWFSDKQIDYEREFSSLTPNKIISRGKSTRLMPGKMYFFRYPDPKYKETLPYYDAFPLVIVVDFTKNGFWGLNLHYLPIPQRAHLLDSLIKFANDDTITDKSKLELSWKLLKSASNHNMIKPCIKRYIGKRIGSKFIEVKPSDWQNAVFLDVAKFFKASQRTVWKDSLRG